MTAAVKAGNPPDFAYTSNVSISQMHLLDLVEDVTDVVDEAVSQLRRHHAGHQRRQDWASSTASGRRFRSLPARTGYFIRGDKLEEKGIDPATLKTFDERREAALAISDPDI